MTVDVAARLAAGRPAVVNTQTYVSACHAVGYQHPDLTAHGAQILEWYGSEDGLDLQVLDADCALLRAAAAAADEAVRRERDGLAALSVAWQGESGSAAADFVERHIAAGAAVAGAVRAAAEACSALRDGLWRLVDEKAGAAVSIDDRRAGERPAWLAAATTVMGGGAAREGAVDVVTQQITPYIDADIRTDWLTAMRSATSSVATAYGAALRQLNAAPPVYFDVPGQLAAPPVSPAPSAAQTAAQTVPAAAPAVAPVLPSSQLGESTPAAPPPSIPDTAAAQPLPPVPLTEPPAPTGFGTAAPGGIPAMPDVAGALSGLVGQIADALGGLFDGMPDTSVDAPAPDPVDDHPPEPDNPVERSGDKPDGDNTDPNADSTEEAVPEKDVPVVEQAADGVGQPPDEPAPADAEPAEAEPPAVEPEPVPAVGPPDERTPCEIAADELPQVGQ